MKFKIFLADFGDTKINILDSTKADYASLADAIKAARAAKIAKNQLFAINDEGGWTHALGLPVGGSVAFITDDGSEATTEQLGVPSHLAIIKEYGNAKKHHNVLTAWNEIQDPRTLLTYAQKIADPYVISLAALECVRYIPSLNRASQEVIRIGSLFLMDEATGDDLRLAMESTKGDYDFKNYAIKAVRYAGATLLFPTASNIAHVAYSSAQALAEAAHTPVETQFPALSDIVRQGITLVDISLPLLIKSRQ